jgi:hypothetical protein
MHTFGKVKVTKDRDLKGAIRGKSKLLVILSAGEGRSHDMLCRVLEQHREKKPNRAVASFFSSYR